MQLQDQQQLSVVSADQQALAKMRQLLPKAGALSDSDVQRVLAHRRAYLKQQRAFDRVCMGSNDAFDPTQVPVLKLLSLLCQLLHPELELLQHVHPEPM